MTQDKKSMAAQPDEQKQTRIFKSKWFQRFAKSNDISDKALETAVEKIEKGLFDADLGGGVIKQRVAKQGQGSATGYRVIVLYRKGDKAFLVFGFEKSQQANLSRDEEKHYKEAAKYHLELTEKQIAELLKNGDLVEIKRKKKDKDDGKKIS